MQAAGGRIYIVVKSMLNKPSDGESSTSRGPKTSPYVIQKRVKLAKWNVLNHFSTCF